MKRKAASKTRRPQVVYLDPRFTPDGSAEEESAVFRAFWIAARSHLVRLKTKRAAKKKRNGPVRRQGLPQLRSGVWPALEALENAAMKGDADAAKALVEETVGAVQWLTLVERKQPELFEAVAKWQLQWPLLASDEPGWEKEAAEMVSRINLGTGIQLLKARFRKARGTDANYPHACGQRRPCA